LNYPGETENKLRYRINRLEEELKEERDDYKPKNLSSLDYYEKEGLILNDKELMQKIQGNPNPQEHDDVLQSRRIKIEITEKIAIPIKTGVNFLFI